MTIIKHEVKMNLKSLVIWSMSVSLMAFVFMLMFPMLENSLKEMGDQFSHMEGLSAAFGMDKLSIYSPMGYYGTQVGFILALGGAMFAGLLGTGMLSKEEGGHTAEFLLTTPISRSQVVLQKVTGLLTIIVIFEIIYVALIMLAFVMIGEPFSEKGFWIYHLAQFCMHLQIACICYGISAFIKKANIGLGLGLVLVLYFLDIMEKTISQLDGLRYITPFTYSGAGDVMTSGKIEGELLLIGIGVSIISIVVAYIKYVKKDIAA